MAETLWIPRLSLEFGVEARGPHRPVPPVVGGEERGRPLLVGSRDRTADAVSPGIQYKLGGELYS